MHKRDGGAQAQSDPKDNNTLAQSKQPGDFNEGSGAGSRGRPAAVVDEKKANDSSKSRAWDQVLKGGVPLVGTRHTPIIFGALVSPPVVSDTQLITVDEKGRVVAWARNGGEWNPSLIHLLAEVPQQVALSLSAARLALAYPGRVKILDLQSGDITAELERIAARVLSIEFSPSGAAVLLGASDSMVYRWSFEDEQKASTFAEREHALERYLGHAAVVSAVRFHPSGRLFFSADWQGALSAWKTFSADLFEGEYDRNLIEGRFFTELAERVRAGRRTPDIVEDMELSGDGARIILVTEQGVLEAWQVRGFKLLAQATIPRGGFTEVAIAPGGSVVATSGRDGTLRLWALDQKPGALRGTYEYVLALKKEIPSLYGSILLFLDDQKLLVGDREGRIVEQLIDFSATRVEEAPQA